MRELAEAVGISPSTGSLHLTRMREDGIDIGTRGVHSRRCPHCGRWQEPARPRNSGPWRCRKPVPRPLAVDGWCLVQARLAHDALHVSSRVLLPSMTVSTPLGSRPRSRYQSRR
ncbi:winged helix-turn-helix domain-containing protein [Streptomyces sp. NPDC006678]|uniref:winged helix-turn-helix domain-containing protein n=1 Tax=unclassified Streptomyces TaxID=2593676 RepID=UPI0033AB1276